MSRLERIKRAPEFARSILGRYARAMTESVRERGTSFLSKDESKELPDLRDFDLGAVWLGHATVLIGIGGKTILTDPVLASRIGIRIGKFTIGPGRLGPIPIAIDHLPPIDVVLISHAHFDHLDKPTLRRLVSRNTTVVTSRSTRRLVPPGFKEVVELDWSEGARIAGMEFQAIRPAHWGARAAFDHFRRCNSYVVETPRRRVLFAGDTGRTDAYDGIGADLAMFGISGYEPWEEVHATPEQVWSMFQAARAERLLPVHHSTFDMGEEGPHEPMQRLMATAGDDAHRVIPAQVGDLWAA